jgi:uncharacterized protein (TIGR02466 family)
VANDPLEPLELFAFPLFSSMVADHEKHHQTLIDEIQAHRRAHPGGMVRSNRDGWHSGPELVVNPSESMRFVLRNALYFARQALAPYYDEWRSSELRLGHFWANILGPHGWNAPHHHHPQHWSGCYYVSVGKIGKVAGEQAGLIEFLNPFPIQSHWGGGSFAYAPRDGLQLLFPSSLVHLVHPHPYDFDRISIAYNFNVVDRPAGAVPD